MIGYPLAKALKNIFTKPIKITKAVKLMNYFKTYKKTLTIKIYSYPLKAVALCFYIWTLMLICRAFNHLLLLQLMFSEHIFVPY